MFLTVVKHGRTKRDTTKLAAHVFKAEENTFVELAQLGNTLATDLPGMLKDTLIARDGVSPGSPSVFHVTPNPARSCSQGALLRVAHMARLELDPESSRPFAIIIHGKPRASGSGARCMRT